MDVVLSKVYQFKKLKPVKRDVLKDARAIEDRSYKLKKGIEYTKFNIQTLMLIVTKDGEKQVKSILYALTSTTITIKGEVELPISCIKEVYYKY